MLEHICPLCHAPLTEDAPSTSGSIDYHCMRADDHYYAHRVKNNEITKVKVRFTEFDGDRLTFKINYDQGTCQFWTQRSEHNRTEIQTIFTPDFSDIDKLKTKIKTYMIFS